MPDRWIILNFVLFQISWLVCVLSAANNTNLPALLMTSIFLAVSLRFYPWKITNLKLIGTGVLVGLLLDTSWSALGWMNYSAQSFSPVAPWWILCLWINFMLTMNHSLSWLMDRPVLTMIFSAVASPISYYAGQSLGALYWLEPAALIIGVSISWATAIPILFWLAKHWRIAEVEKPYAVG